MGLIQERLELGTLGPKTERQVLHEWPQNHHADVGICCSAPSYQGWLR